MFSHTINFRSKQAWLFTRQFFSFPLELFAVCLKIMALPRIPFISPQDAYQSLLFPGMQTLQIFITCPMLSVLCLHAWFILSWAHGYNNTYEKQQGHGYDNTREKQQGNNLPAFCQIFDRFKKSYLINSLPILRELSLLVLHPWNYQG